MHEMTRTLFSATTDDCRLHGPRQYFNKKRPLKNATPGSMLSPAGLLGAALIAGIFLSPALAQASTVAACDFGDVSFVADFPGGKLDGCAQNEDGSYSLRFDPEDQPINHSPWYAFRVSGSGDQEIIVHLNYSLHRHRYWPKLSADGANWFRASTGAVDVDKDSGSASLRLHLDGSDLWVAGQEIIDNDQHRRWANELAGSGVFDLSVLGESAEGRDILKLESSAKKGRYIALVGRQHPPEVTGALALHYFSQRLVEDDELARRFRDQFGIILVPNLNPDGVARGHWRHGTGGVDLNRDWGPFTQAETRLVRDEFSRFSTDDDETLYLFLDFHSTRYDVLYTQLPAMETFPKNFTWQWIDRLQSALSDVAPGYPVIVKPGHNPGRPTSKAYMYATYGVPAITFELGDETDRQFIYDYSRIAAEQVMLELLDALERQRG